MHESTSVSDAGCSRQRSGVCSSVQCGVTPNSFVAGCVAGAVGSAVGHPLDTIKVWTQTGKQSVPSLTALFRGAGIPMISAGCIQCLNLGGYENLRRLLPFSDAWPLCGCFVAATSTGLGISLLTCPLNRIKVVQQLSHPGTSMWIAGSTIVGTRTLYTGWGMTACFESSRGMYMVTYEVLKQALHRLDESQPLPVWARSVAGALANMVVWAVVYPVDVIRSVQQSEAPLPNAASGKDGIISGRPLGAIECARALHAEGGLGRLYRGIVPTILRAGPVAGIMLPLFELILQRLEDRTLALTGSTTSVRLS